MKTETLPVKERIILVAERLFAMRGLDGVSLRQIGAESGNANNSAVQYHFGSKELLVQAIFEYRLPQLEQRRGDLIAARRPSSLRSWIECYVRPILEQGEQEGSYYLSFVAMLLQHADRHLFDLAPINVRNASTQYLEHMASLVPDMPEPLRRLRLFRVISFAVHAAADRERATAAGISTLPFDVHVADLLDGLMGFLQAPVSTDALAALADNETINVPVGSLIAFSSASRAI